MSIAQKLSELAANLEEPPKSGYLDYQNHEYWTLDDLYNAIRGELAERGLDWSPDAELLTIKPKGDGDIFAAVKVTITFRDIENDKTLTTSAVGAADGDDKSVAAAQTQAVRFAIKNKFQMSDGMAEAMYGHTTGGGGAQTQQQNVHRDQAPQNQQPPLDAIGSRLSSLGFSDNQIEAFGGYIANIEGASSIAGVAQGRLQVWADRLSELTDEQARQKVMDAVGGGQQAA